MATDVQNRKLREHISTIHMTGSELEVEQGSKFPKFALTDILTLVRPYLLKVP